ncbi:hypothetical protein M0811_08780 [Anaeramoeba ignava]|uniref:Uncharacterized protein n=1 Tax=Anaeramoeba ignava TaxID=1746090 RepID=A0A9Q0LIC6_ANAIG|nr:hypothetical protein M0811_08780 [Anaeramoeba ignava]|eukprot:Anaeramoba_ignava/a217705_71.p1 GENE.a217705_71~~a217705_71.p1  ORF type:complete len:252 (-),score=23.31 a217705_71:113-868(-)
MCFNQPISFLFTIGSFINAQYLRRAKFLKNDKRIWRMAAGVDYFAAMELIQFLQYFWIDQCDSVINKILTILGIIHIAFQPFIANLMTSYDIPKRMEKSFDRLVMPLSILTGIFSTSRLIGYEYFPCSDLYDPLCSKVTCTTTGRVHLRWGCRLRTGNYFTPSAFPNFFFMFVPTILAGKLRASLLLFFSGPVIGYALARNKDEWASIWCYYTFVQCLVGSWISLNHYDQKQARKQKDAEEYLKEQALESN